jgi:hypothetical protein
MTKKVDKRAAKALIEGEVGQVSSNTDIVPVAIVNGPKGVPKAKDCFELRIFGNGIAAYDQGTDTLYLRNCGYETVTTKNRLNAVLRAAGYEGRTPIYQRDYEWYFGEQDFYDVVGRHEYKRVEVSR